MMSNRISWTVLFVVALVACGDDGGATPDAPAPDIGFNKPTKSLKANNETAPDVWAELGPADLACLNTPNADMATTVAVSLATTVEDFQSGNPAPGTVVTVFPDQATNQPFAGSPYTADGDANVTVTIPVGTKRFGFKMTSDSSLDTLLLNQTVAPDQMNQTLSSINSVSKSTAQTLPALIGVSRTQGTGVLAGAVRDCAGNEISNFIATVSSTKGAVNHLPGADTYYFSSTVGLPVKHQQKAAASENGLFMVIEIAPSRRRRPRSSRCGATSTTPTSAWTSSR
jgi:hypothetical protein